MNLIGFDMSFIVREYLSVRDENYLKWSIDQIVNWNQKTPLNDVANLSENALAKRTPKS